MYVHGHIKYYLRKYVQVLVTPCGFFLVDIVPIYSKTDWISHRAQDEIRHVGTINRNVIVEHDPHGLYILF